MKFTGNRDPKLGGYYNENKRKGMSWLNRVGREGNQNMEKQWGRELQNNNSCGQKIECKVTALEFSQKISSHGYIKSCRITWLQVY